MKIDLSWKEYLTLLEADLPQLASVQSAPSTPPAAPAAPAPPAAAPAPAQATAPAAPVGPGQNANADSMTNAVTGGGYWVGDKIGRGINSIFGDGQKANAAPAPAAAPSPGPNLVAGGAAKPINPYAGLSQTKDQPAPAAAVQPTSIQPVPQPYAQAPSGALPPDVMSQLASQVHPMSRHMIPNMPASPQMTSAQWQQMSRHQRGM